MKFASMLKKLREENSITQEILAHNLGITRSTVAGYETKDKQPDYERLLQIADYFHVSVDYLLTGSESSTLSTIYTDKKAEQQLLKAYAKLSLESQEQVQDYIQLLELKEKSMR